MIGTATYRDFLLARVPRWMRETFIAGRTLFGIGVHLDLLGDAVVDGVRRKFPGLDSGDSLPRIGRERRIRRGPNEADATYAARLIPWLTDHKTRGGPYAMLAQVGAFYAASPRALQLVYRNGRRYQRDADDGEIERDDITWTPDAYPERWARWWLFHEWPTAVASDGTWADAGDWSDGGVWDSDLSPAEVSDVRLVPTEWNAAHCRDCWVVLLNANAELWDMPAGTWDDPGTWGVDDTTGIARISITGG